ncbi:DUF3978 family protein [Bacillus sp. DX1.1]|uniref:DUF3978 family protein n=1 Tax=unclassified Bacillus (in: firmicutes) TaxID=185979 RepID=UPI002570317F|nr:MULTISPECIES: DUF3978 family protein [unclassified Bacillus (in: firmicutes)]MDM5157154.1 DUF3978 family protein [Bacillus sp. DX1.1]WJE84179.1 DUF3978 family protein [Bacillus sp. DX3.1]
MHNVVHTQAKSNLSETIFSLHICEENEFDSSLRKSTTLSFIVSRETVKVLIKKSISYKPDSIDSKSYIIPSQAFHYLFPTICENDEEIIVHVQIFGKNGEFLLNNRLFINKNLNHKFKVQTFFETINENIYRALYNFQAY